MTEKPDWALPGRPKGTKRVKFYAEWLQDVPEGQGFEKGDVWEFEGIGGLTVEFVSPNSRPAWVRSSWEHDVSVSFSDDPDHLRQNR